MRRTISSVAATLALTALVTAACNKKLRDYGEVDGHAGDSGKPGKSEGGQGGDAGPGQGETLSVVDVAPPSGAVDVERDVPIVVTFSAAVDPESVTTSTFEVVGVNGPIAGTLTVEDEVVTFRPERRWHLHSEVTVKVSTDLKGGRGERLAEGAESSFFVRDGEFGVPQLLSPEFSQTPVSAGNRAGHAVLAWKDPERTSITAFVFDAETASWTNATALSNVSDENMIPRVAINATGEALAVWHNGNPSPSSVGWSRYRKLEGWSSAQTLDRTNSPGSWLSVALDDDGLAVGLWSNSSDDEPTVWSSWLEEDWSTPIPMEGASGTPRAFHLGTEFLAITQRASDDAYVARLAAPSGSWISSAVLGGHSMIAVDGTSAIATFLVEGTMEAAWYEKEVWSPPTKLGSGAYHWGEVHLLDRQAIAVWPTSGNGVRCARAEEASWEAPVDLGISSGYPAPTTVLDRAGNAMVFWPTEGSTWPEGESMTWRRYRRGAGWSPPDTLPYAFEGVRAFADSQGNVLAVFMNEDGVWYSRFE